VRALEPLKGEVEGDGTIVEIPGSIPGGLFLESSHILVRPEYEEAEQAALAANAAHFDAFLVGGQSGIGPPLSSSPSTEPNLESGKTVFLIWLPMRRLTLKLPTVLQASEEFAILFHEGGTSKFTCPTQVDRYLGLEHDDYSGRIWALIGSDLLPAQCFRADNPFFVVEAASRRDRFDWASKVHHQHFYMQTWAFSEVLQMYVALPSEVHNTYGFCSRPFLGLECDGPHEESQLRYLYDTYRASPRELAMYARMPALYENRVDQEVMNIRPGDLRDALYSPTSSQSSYLIMRMEPSPKSRNMFEKMATSQHVLKLLSEKHLKNTIAEVELLYNTLQGSSVTASAVRGILELRMHQLFAFMDEYPLL